MKKALVQMAGAGWTALAVSLAQGETIAYWPGIAITTNALSTASWGYTVDHLGEYHNETAVVITNGTATWTAPAALENVRFLVVGGGGGGGGGGDVNTSEN